MTFRFKINPVKNLILLTITLKYKDHFIVMEVKGQIGSHSSQGPTANIQSQDPRTALIQSPLSLEQDSLSCSLLKGIANSCFKLKILSDTSKTLRFYLEREDGTFELLSQDQVKGILQNKLLKREIYDHFFIKLTHEDGRPKVQFCGKLAGGSKIPVVDEIFRSFGSLGDFITGNSEHAFKRWQNWTEDSFLANSGKSIGFTIASGATAMVGQTETAKNLIEKAGDSGQKLGGMTLSSAYQAVGVGAQIITLGIPNPVSGACTEFSSRTNQVIDKNVKEGKYGVDWEQYAAEGVIGMARGGASSGGLIPYAGNAVEKAIRGEKMEFDHGQEWGQWGINMATTAITAGTVKGVGKLSSMGKIGLKSAMGTGFAVGTVTGVASGYLSQELHSCAIHDKITGNGYIFSRNEQKDGKIYAIYCKKGEPDVIVPCPNLGDAIGNGLLQGIMLALSAGRQHVKNKPKPTPQPTPQPTAKPTPKPKATNTYQGQIDENRMAQIGSTETGDQVMMIPGTEQEWEVQSTNDLAKALTGQQKWIKVSSQNNTGIEIINKVNQAGNLEVAFLEHATENHTFGPFNPENIRTFTNLIDKLKIKALNDGGLNIQTIYLFGCEVTSDFKAYLQNTTGIQVKTMPHLPNSRLQIVPGTYEFKYMQEIAPNQYKVIYHDHLANITKYMG